MASPSLLSSSPLNRERRADSMARRAWHSVAARQGPLPNTGQPVSAIARATPLTTSSMYWRRWKRSFIPSPKVLGALHICWWREAHAQRHSKEARAVSGSW